MTGADERPADEVFSLVADPSRLAILRALAADPGRPVSFTALHERVDIRDSGRFNYHLSKLLGSFVRAGEDGYALTVAGHQLVGAVASGRYTVTADVEARSLDDPCPRCGDPLRVETDDGLVRIACTGCGRAYSEFSIPAATLAQDDPEALPATLARWAWSILQETTAGFCTNCSGPLTRRLDLAADTGDHRITFTCPDCGHAPTVAPFVAALPHPGVAGFLYSHGIDVRETPIYRLESLLDRTTTILDDDPATIELALTLDDETLRCTLAHDGTITDLTRK